MTRCQIAFICWKGQYDIVFGPFEQIKDNRKQTVQSEFGALQINPFV